MFLSSNYSCIEIRNLFSCKKPERIKSLDKFFKKYPGFNGLNCCNKNRKSPIDDKREERVVHKIEGTPVIPITIAPDV